MLRSSDRPRTPAGNHVSWFSGVRGVVLSDWPGWLLLLGGAFVKLTAAALRGLLGALPVAIEFIDTLGSLALVGGLGVWVVRLATRARRRLLWRVRRKLILSYIFIGVVPALLIVAFFVVSGLMLFLNVGSYLVRSSLQDIIDEARFAAETTIREVDRGSGPAAAAAVLAERQATLVRRYPGAALALVPTAAEPCSGRPSETVPAGRPAPSAVRASVVLPIAVGDWEHVDPPRQLPSWVSCTGFSGLLAVGPSSALHERMSGQVSSRDEILLVVRAASLPPVPRPTYAVVIDIPVNERLKAWLREQTSVKLGQVSVAPVSGDVGALPLAPRRRPAIEESRPPEPESVDQTPRKWRWLWVALVDYTDWTTGWLGDATMRIEVNIADIYDRISAGQVRSGLNVGQGLFTVLLLLAVLFLFIEFAALVMGLLLARSITGSVHQLFTGTERARQGDFGYKIPVVARDQLGELAESFNEMTTSIVALLQQADEKKRLEEELRIAREIQMSLLPHETLAVPGVSMTAICVPAREVGGDYFDFLPLDDGQLGLLIADVSGKGTSAAFYMAELKGLMLSLSQIHRSPRELLIHANRIISHHLDSRSFITMIYAVLDVEARTLTYARAGHTPLIVRMPQAGRRPKVQVLAPDGMVLGVRVDGGELFARLLEEETLALEPGALVLFFTDGLSEAMNAESECFGEARLAGLLHQHGDLAPEALRERILSEIQAFVGNTPQHDDMTMILVKVEPGREAAAAGPTDGRALAPGSQPDGAV